MASGHSYGNVYKGMPNEQFKIRQHRFKFKIVISVNFFNGLVLI